LAQIPAVYQSPERFDTNTNYVVPVGKTTAFSGPRGSHPRRWEDGLANAVLLLEVDDDDAVPWTAPRDWTFDAQAPDHSLGNLRSDGFFAGWGGGTLAAVPSGTNDNNLRAMFTIDGGESFDAAAVCTAALADVVSQGQVTVASQVDTNRTPSAGSKSSQLSQSSASTGESNGTRNPDPLVDNVDLADLAQQAYAAGLQAEGVRLSMAAFLSDEPAATIEYQWIPALRRPVSDVHFGVGVDYSGADTLSVRNQLGHSIDSRDGPPPKLLSIVGDLAQPVFDQLQDFRPIVSAVAAAQATSGRQRGTAIRLTTLCVADLQTVLKAARIHDVDVVLMFNVEDKTTRRGMKAKSVGLSVWDTWNRREIFNQSPINYLRRENSRLDPLYRDPVERAAERFGQFVARQLRPVPLPESLKPELAGRRVVALSKLQRDNPLPLLSEIRFYRQLDLVTVEQQLAAYQSLLGAKAGTELLAGSAAEKRQAIAKWIPDIRLQVADASRRATSNVVDRDE
jgi:hypothetical protein